MTLRLLTFLIITCCLTQCLSAQQLTGKVYEALTDSLLPGVNVFNQTTRASARTNASGEYTLAAKENEVLVFSVAGYIPDTIVVQWHMLQVAQDITLYRQTVSLENVTVKNNWVMDSIANRAYYSDLFRKQAGLTNRRSSGFGVSVSPFSFFSARAKSKRQLNRRLKEQEREDYIDMAFPEPWVRNVTGLSGDSLSRFMYSYRPSYKFCRENGRTEMLLYINDKLKEFRKPGSSR